MVRRLAYVLATVAVAGCGSTTHSTTAATSGQTTTVATGTSGVATRAQFIARADAICQAAQAEIAPLKARVDSLRSSDETSPATLKTLATLLRENVAMARTVQKKLEALPKPRADSATIEKMIVSFSEEITYKNGAAKAVANGDMAQLSALGKLDNKAKSFEEGLAQGYGMKVCGRSE